VNRLARIAAWIVATLATPAGAEVVLLTNGSLLQGRVERRAGEEVVVHQPGGAILLPSTEVLCVDQSPLAVYEWLRAQRVGEGPAVGQHLALADWAMENRLWPQAARELIDARQLDPRDRRLALLERRFDELTRPRPTAPMAASLPTPEPTPPEPTVELAALPDLPEGSLEHFTRRIQPLLRNGCASVGCHRGGADDALGLDPVWVGGHADASTTDHNLRAVIAAIDFESPEASPLLAAVRGPHYGATPFTGARRGELIERVETWVRELAAENTDSPPEEPGTVAADGVAPAAEPERRLQPIVDDRVQPATYEAPAPRVRRGARLTPVGPRDEFDPAIFNERFRRPEDDLPLNDAAAPPR